MKKLFFLSAVCGLAVAASAVEPASTAIYSCNTVGVQRVSGTSKESAVTVPMPFKAIGGTVAKLDASVFMDNTSLNTFQLCADSQSGYYSQWISLAGYGAGLLPVARTVNNVSVSPLTADEQQLNIGVGLIVNRTNPNTPVYLMGEYAGDALQTTIAANTRTYLCNPLDQSFDLDAKLTQNVSEDDVVYVNDGSKDHEYRYSSEGQGGQHWYEKINKKVIVTNPRTGKQTISSKPVAYYGQAVISKGQGFFYLRNANTPLTIAW